MFGGASRKSITRNVSGGGGETPSRLSGGGSFFTRRSTGGGAPSRLSGGVSFFARRSTGGGPSSRLSGGGSFFTRRSTEEDSNAERDEDEQAAVEAAEDAAAEAAATADVKSQRLAAAIRNVAILSQQHVLVYTRDAEFASQVPDDDVQDFYSLDEYERERVGAMLSALYAHPQVAIRPYRAQYAPPTDARGGGGFVSGVPGHASGLEGFVADVLEDIWSRISLEFPPNPAKDVVMWHEREPEFSLQHRLPFYFSRSVQEHTVVRCIKLGRPK